MIDANSRARIVLANGSLARYPQAGGHWSWFLQFVLGLEDLGHDVVWLELLASSGDPTQDQCLVDGFFNRAGQYGITHRCVLLLYGANSPSQAMANATVYGMEMSRLNHLCRTADACWNFATALQEPLLSLFRRRALIDTDPGHLQVSATQWDLGLQHHDSFLTVGTRVNQEDCEIPTLGFGWRPFLPFVHLPFWGLAPENDPKAPFTSITQWTWEELWWDRRVLSVSKRDAYLRYVTLPSTVDTPLELAVNIHRDDSTGDRELLAGCGWRLCDPHVVAGTPSLYAAYIGRSRGELCCPKPIYRQLRTGWFSDRSASYLASGRPVLVEDTGFADYLPVGEGLLSFSTVEEAAAGIQAIQGQYRRHAAAARDLAVDLLDARKILPGLVEATVSTDGRTQGKVGRAGPRG